MPLALEHVFQPGFVEVHDANDEELALLPGEERPEGYGTSDKLAKLEQRQGRGSIVEQTTTKSTFGRVENILKEFDTDSDGKYSQEEVSE